MLSSPSTIQCDDCQSLSCFKQDNLVVEALISGIRDLWLGLDLNYLKRKLFLSLLN